MTSLIYWWRGRRDSNSRPLAWQLCVLIWGGSVSARDTRKSKTYEIRLCKFCVNFYHFAPKFKIFYTFHYTKIKAESVGFETALTIYNRLLFKGISNAQFRDLSVTWQYYQFDTTIGEIGQERESRMKRYSENIWQMMVLKTWFLKTVDWIFRNLQIPLISLWYID